MGVLSWLFSSTPKAGPQALQPDPVRLMTPDERQTLLGQRDPAEMRYNDWQSGKSSWISALRYNPIAGYAQMRVKKGKIYTFGGMTFGMFVTWFSDSSWGGFFNRYLKGKYTQWAGFQTLGMGIRAESNRASGMTILGELGMR